MTSSIINSQYLKTWGVDSPIIIFLILLLLLLPITGACNNQMDVKLMTGDVGRSFESTSCEASEGSLSFNGHESGQPIQKSKECCKDVSKVSHVVGSKKRSDQVSLLQVRVLTHVYIIST